MKKPILLVAMGLLLTLPMYGGTILYNNLTPNDSIGFSSSVQAGSKSTETADDFFLTGNSTITGASFIGIMPAGVAPLNVTIEIYRVFPLDSDTVRTPAVPTRNNSPSDVELTHRSSGAGELTFSTTQLSTSFTTANSILEGGLSVNAGGNGAITGQEVQFDVTFSTPINLASGHYFFVPQIDLGGADFLWLSAPRPISGAGTTPFTPDLQVWMRDGFLDPDWLRAGTDIVGGNPAPTYNASFELFGTVPEPGSLVLFLSGALGLLSTGRIRRNR